MLMTLKDFDCWPASLDIIMLHQVQYIALNASLQTHRGNLTQQGALQLYTMYFGVEENF